MPHDNDRKDEKTDLPLATKVDSKTQPDSRAQFVFTEDAFVIPPQNLAASNKDRLEKFYQQPVVCEINDAKDSNALAALHTKHPNLPKLYAGLVKWGKDNKCDILNTRLSELFSTPLSNLQDKMLEYSKRPSQFDDAILFLECFFLHLTQQETQAIGDKQESPALRAKQKLYEQFREDISYCQAGVYNKLQILYNLLNSPQNFREFIFRTRLNIVEDFSHLFANPSEEEQQAQNITADEMRLRREQNSHNPNSFNNHAYQQNWGLPFKNDPHANVVAKVSAFDREQFHQYFVEHYTPARMINEIVYEIDLQLTTLANANGLAATTVKQIIAAEKTTKYLKKALEKALEMQKILPQRIMQIVAAAQGSLAEKYAENLKKALQGDFVVPKDIKLSPDDEKNLRGVLTTLKQHAFSTAELDALNDGKLPPSDAAKTKLETIGIDEKWLTEIKDPEAIHWNPRDNYHLITAYTAFEDKASSYFKALGFAESPEIINLFDYATLQFNKSALRPVILQQLYKEQKLFKSYCWQTIELNKSDKFPYTKLHLFFNSPEQSEIELFWLEDIHGNPKDLQQHLIDNGNHATQFEMLEILLTRLKNSQQLSSVISALIASLPGNLLINVMGVIVKHLENDPATRKQISAKVFGRLIYNLVKTGSWSTIELLLELDIAIDLNSYCDPDTGDFPLHTAIKKQKFAIAKMMGEKNANLLFINKKNQTPKDILDLVSQDSKQVEEDRDELARFLADMTTNQLTPSDLGQALAQNADYNFTDGVVMITSRMDEKANIDFRQLSPITRRSAFFSAYLYQNNDLLKRFRKYAFDLTQPNSFSGKNIYQLAIENCHDSYFIEYIADSLKNKTALTTLDQEFCAKLLSILIFNSNVTYITNAQIQILIFAIVNKPEFYICLMLILDDLRRRKADSIDNIKIISATITEQMVTYTPYVCALANAIIAQQDWACLAFFYTEQKSALSGFKFSVTQINLIHQKIIQANIKDLLSWPTIKFIVYLYGQLPNDDRTNDIYTKLLTSLWTAIKKQPDLNYIAHCREIFFIFISRKKLALAINFYNDFPECIAAQALLLLASMQNNQEKQTFAEMFVQREIQLAKNHSNPTPTLTYVIVLLIYGSFWDKLEALLNADKFKIDFDSDQATMIVASLKDAVESKSNTLSINKAIDYAYKIYIGFYFNSKQSSKNETAAKLSEFILNYLPQAKKIKDGGGNLCNALFEYLESKNTDLSQQHIENLVNYFLTNYQQISSDHQQRLITIFLRSKISINMLEHAWNIFKQNSTAESIKSIMNNLADNTNNKFIDNVRNLCLIQARSIYNNDKNDGNINKLNEQLQILFAILTYNERSNTPILEKDYALQFLDKPQESLLYYFLYIVDLRCQLELTDQFNTDISFPNEFLSTDNLNALKLFNFCIHPVALQKVCSLFNAPARYRTDILVTALETNRQWYPALMLSSSNDETKLAAFSHNILEEFDSLSDLKFKFAFERIAQYRKPHLLENLLQKALQLSAVNKVYTILVVARNFLSDIQIKIAVIFLCRNYAAIVQNQEMHATIWKNDKLAFILLRILINCASTTTELFFIQASFDPMLALFGFKSSATLSLSDRDIATLKNTIRNRANEINSLIRPPITSADKKSNYNYNFDDPTIKDKLLKKILDPDFICNPKNQAAIYEFVDLLRTKKHPGGTASWAEILIADLPDFLSKEAKKLADTLQSESKLSPFLTYSREAQKRSKSKALNLFATVLSALSTFSPRRLNLNNILSKHFNLTTDIKHTTIDLKNISIDAKGAVIETSTPFTLSYPVGSTISMDTKDTKHDIKDIKSNPIATGSATAATGTTAASEIKQLELKPKSVPAPLLTSLATQVSLAYNMAFDTKEHEQQILAGSHSTRVKDFFMAAKMAAQQLCAAPSSPTQNNAADVKSITSMDIKSPIFSSPLDQKSEAINQAALHNYLGYTISQCNQTAPAYLQSLMGITVTINKNLSDAVKEYVLGYGLETSSPPNYIAAAKKYRLSLKLASSSHIDFTLIQNLICEKIAALIDSASPDQKNQKSILTYDYYVAKFIFLDMQKQLFIDIHGFIESILLCKNVKPSILLEHLFSDMTNSKAEVKNLNMYYALIYILVRPHADLIQTKEICKLFFKNEFVDQKKISSMLVSFLDLELTTLGNNDGAMTYRKTIASTLNAKTQDLRGKLYQITSEPLQVMISFLDKYSISSDQPAEIKALTKKFSDYARFLLTEISATAALTAAAASSLPNIKP